MIATRIVSRRSAQPAGRLVRPAGFALAAAAALLVAVPAAPVFAATTLSAQPADQVSDRPQWVAHGDSRAARRLIGLLRSAGLDGLNPARFDGDALEEAIQSAETGDPRAMVRASQMLDRALTAYVAALRSAPAPEWIINDREAVPNVPSPASLLADAASAPSLEVWVDSMPFMHPSYAQLRRALADAEGRGDERAEALLRLNLSRARMLPAGGRYVVVNTAAQQLYMYEDGREVDRMRVVVGKPHQPTPMMAATIKFTALNPYWNVPADLAAERVAPFVVRDGLGYLETHGYVVLSDWSDRATPVDPATIDWAAVAAGRTQIRLRQEPGPNNAMGQMKFMFPNPQGIYLHDTPNKELLNEDARLFSGGCVRLEDAPRLARWLYGEPLDPAGARTEEPVELPKPVPVYLIYQTAVPSGGQLVFYDDIYGRDQSQLAGTSGLKFSRR